MECKGSCGFFGSEDNDGYCSYCFRGIENGEMSETFDAFAFISKAQGETLCKQSLGLEESKLIQRSDGFVCEVKSASQTDEALKPLITKYHSPSYICGQFSCANASYMSQKYPQEEMTIEEIKQMLTELQNLSTDYQPIEDLLALWNKWRTEWMTKNPHEFTSDGEKESYLKDWVANYEISDWIKLNNDKGIAFVRIVGVEDEEKVKHEEGIRYKEEAPFRESDIIFIDDPFLKEGQQYWHPEAWIACFFDENIPKCSKVFIADVSGHFVVFKPIILIDEDIRKNVLLVVNSFHCDTLPNMCASAFYDLYFKRCATLCKK